MFKSLIPAVVIVSALAAPALASAQEAAPLTRAQVRAELVQLEKAGYSPGAADQATYPAQLQAAEARVSATQGQSAYGAVAAGTSATGSRAAEQTGPQAVYFGH